MSSYVAYLVMAAIAVRQMSESDCIRIDDNEEQELENHRAMDSSNHLVSDHIRLLMSTR